MRAIRIIVLLIAAGTVVTGVMIEGTTENPTNTIAGDTGTTEWVIEGTQAGVVQAGHKRVNPPAGASPLE